MEDEHVNDVFKLVTNLCEKFFTHPQEIQTARIKTYEILLGKSIPKQKKAFSDLKESADPYCNLLAWQFKLRCEYDLKDHADELQQCVEIVQKCYGSDTEGFKTVLQFLLSLRNLPSKDEKILDLASLPSVEEYDNFNKLFKLPPSLVKECENAFHQELFTNSETSIGNICAKKRSDSESKLFKSNFENILKDEGYSSPTKTLDINIWEVVSKLKYSHRRNWENYGYPEPDKERPFLSELGALSSLWVENLESLYLVKLFKDGTVFTSKMVPRKMFIRDLRYLLVGMASDCFSFNENGEFYLLPNITVEGITPDTLNLFCRDLVYCGTCYKALNRMSVPGFESGKYRYEGYIFKEFCENINRYLKFYQTAVFNIPDSTNYLQFYETTHQLQLQISTLASICKVGPYTNAEDMPHGVALLNYLYQKVLALTEQKLIIVLYSILYPCCQVYFSRFLKQWILEGIIDDPYGEFFIKPDSKYIISRGRTYWTRSYTIREDLVPDFLVNLKINVLSCGKAMNLLKFCHYSSKLCLHLMGKKHPIISCCLTLDQLSNLKQITANYFLDVCSECGPRFKWSQVLKKPVDDPILLRLITKKQGATLKRLELERQKILEEEREKRSEEMNVLREQYLIALQQKQSRIAQEVESEIKLIEETLEIDLKRQKLIHEEANNMITYYSELFKIADNKKLQIDKNIEMMRRTQLDHNVAERCKETPKSTENVTEQSNSSCESFHTGFEGDDPVRSDQNGTPPLLTEKSETEVSSLRSSNSMDIINANTVHSLESVSDNNANISKIPHNIQQAIDNFETARKIKAKVMTQEMGIDYAPKTPEKPKDQVSEGHLTDAQKNKLKVLSHEFGMDLKPEIIKTNRDLDIATVNKNRVLGVSDCFRASYLDNECFLNRNVDNVEENTKPVATIRKSQSLKLDFERASVKSRKSESEKPVPMSVDSTPISDLPPSESTTPSTTFISIDTNHLDNILNTADTQQTDEGFKFFSKSETVPEHLKQSFLPKAVFSKRVTMQEASGISTNCLKLFLYQSIQVPLVTQSKLVNDELLKYFINELGYLKHLNYLRDYFFLQDGEFGRTILDNLFSRLYNANFPMELINCRTLKDLIFGAQDMSSKHQGASSCLSFKTNNLPKCFDLGNPDVLDCVSLTYEIRWPLNILLPTDTIAKYDEVFKFLFKLNRMSWVLKRIFLELKVLAKETGKKEIYLMSSPQYRKLHQCRHVMTQFIQTLQSYVVGEVLQSRWEIFEKNLMNCSTLDEIYEAHTSYIKNILFMCLLNQKTAALRNVIHKIFVVILKFFDYLRSRSWMCEDGSYVHPNFKKLESIFRNFEELVLYFFKVGRKVAKSGYQPHLFQLLDMLDINGYISNLLNSAH